MCQRFRGFMGFVVSVVLWVSWFQRFRGFMSFVVSWVSWFHRFHGFLAFMGLIFFLFIRRNIFFMLKINKCTCQTQVEMTNFYVVQKKKQERKKVFSPILEEIYGIRSPGFWAPDGIFNKTLQTLLPKKCFYHPRKHANTVIVCILSNSLTSTER